MAETEQTRYKPSFETDYSTLRAERQAEQEAESQDSLSRGELWSLAREADTVSGALDRNRQTKERTESYGDAPEVPVQQKQERLKKVEKDYTDTELEFLAEYVNEDDFVARQERIVEDRKREQLLQSEGLRGLGYRLAAGMTDEYLLPLYVGTGGIGAVARQGLLRRTLGAGAAGAAEGALIEGALSQSDTQRDWTDVVMGAIGGGVISSSIPLGAAGYKRLRHGKEPKANPNVEIESPEALADARAVDADLNTAVKDYVADTAVQDIERAMGSDSMLTLDARQSLIDELMPVAQTRMRRGDRNVILNEQASVRNQLEQLNQSREAIPGPEAGGTARQRRVRADERLRRQAEIDERIRPVQARLDELDAQIEADLPARDAWADISRLAQGQVPERLEGRLRELVEAQMTPMQREERSRAQKAFEASTARKDAEAKAEGARLDAEAETREPTSAETEEESTAGAQQVADFKNPEDTYPLREEGDVAEEVQRMTMLGTMRPNQDRLRRLAGAGVKVLKSPFSRLDASPSSAVRGLAYTLFSDPQAAGRGHVPAAIYQDTFMRRIMNAEGGREHEARMEWAKEVGIRPIKMQLGIGRDAIDFDNAVVLQMRGEDQGSPAIKKAAEGRRDMLAEALKIRKEAGEGGFEEVDQHDAYWSFITDMHKMQRAVGKHGKEAVIDTLTGAYMNGRFKIPERTARLVANAQYARTMNRGLTGNKDVKDILRGKDLENLRNDLESVGFPTERIDDFLAEMEDVKIQESMSNRAKLSLGASMTYKHSNGLRTVDLIDTTANVGLNYGREASAGAALARSGFKTRSRAEDTILESERTALNLIDSEVQELEAANKKSPVADFKEQMNALDDKRKNLKEDVQQLLDGIKLLYGESLDVNQEGLVSPWVKFGRGLRKYTNIMRLGWNGFAGMSEVSNQLVNMGIRGTLRNTRFKDFASFGKMRASEDLQGFQKLVGAYGQKFSYIHDNNYALQTMDEVNQGRLERIMNNGLGYISNKTQLMSGYRSIQHGYENILMRSMQDRLLRIANGEMKPSARDWDELERAGLTRREAEEVFNHIRNNPETVTMDGEEVRIFSGEGMDPALRDKLGATMTSMLARNMQQSFVGDTPIWMSKEMGKQMTQFRSFSIASVERQTLGGLRGDKMGAFLKLSFGLALGAGSYYSRAYLKSQLSDDPEESWARYTDWNNVTIGVANMAPHIGFAGLGMEAMATAGLMDSDAVASRSGVRPFTPSESIPSVGMATDVLDAVRTAGGADPTEGFLFNLDTEAGQDAAKKVYGVTPFVNTAAIGTAIGLANKIRD